jgi:membrane dipeptidase
MVIDGTCPGDHWRDAYETWREGGVSCCVVSVAVSVDCRTAIAQMAELFRFVRERADTLVIADSTRAIETARKNGLLAVVLQFQGTHPLEYDPNLVELYWRLGVRVIQLAYNHRSPVCDGCEEPANAGLSRLGRTVVGEMNRLGIVVDVSHTGERASFEAIEVSSSPVVASHSNAAQVHASPRNISDELIQAIAASGGVIGAVGFPAFVSSSSVPTLDEYIDHMVHVSELVGPQHAAIGLDYWFRDPPRSLYDELIRSGDWSPTTYPPPPWRYPEGLDDASHFPTLAQRLLGRGFSTSETAGIMGENWMRVFKRVWSS